MRDEETEFNSVENNIHELPSMVLTITETKSDFVTMQYHFKAKGHTSEECKRSMDYLINKSKTLPVNNGK